MVATYDEHEESEDGEQDDAMESGDISILNLWVGRPGVVKRMHLPIIESTRLDQGEVLKGLQHDAGHGGSTKMIMDEIQRREWDPEIKKFLRHHLEDKVVVKEWRMIRPR
nr:hypothetical protein [Tanacetum cinerariifolium]